MTEAEHKITDKTITEMLLQHFKDDNDRFEKLTQLALQNGEHLSYFNKNLEEVKSILVRNAEDTKNYRKTVDEHMSRVEPVIKAYEDSLVLDKSIKRVMVKTGMYASFIGALGTIGYAIIWVAKKFL